MNPYGYILLALVIGVALGFALCAILSANGNDDDELETRFFRSADSELLDQLIENRWNVCHIKNVWAVLRSEDNTIKAIGPDLRANIERAARQDNG